MTQTTFGILKMLLNFNGRFHLTVEFSLSHETVPQRPVMPQMAWCQLGISVIVHYMVMHCRCIIVLASDDTRLNKSICALTSLQSTWLCGANAAQRAPSPGLILITHYQPPFMGLLCVHFNQLMGWDSGLLKITLCTRATMGIMKIHIITRSQFVPGLWKGHADACRDGHY